MVVGCGLPELCSSTPEHSVPPHLVCAPTVLSSGHLADGSGAWLGRAALTADIMSWRATMQVNSTNISNKRNSAGKVSGNHAPPDIRQWLVFRPSTRVGSRFVMCKRESPTEGKRVEGQERSYPEMLSAPPAAAFPRHALPLADPGCRLGTSLHQNPNRSAASHSRHHRHHRHPRPQNRHQGPPPLSRLRSSWAFIGLLTRASHAVHDASTHRLLQGHGSPCGRLCQCARPAWG